MLNTPTLTYHDPKSEVYTIGGAIVRDSTMLLEGHLIVSLSHFPMSPALVGWVLNPVVNNSPFTLVMKEDIKVLK